LSFIVESKCHGYAEGRTWYGEVSIHISVVGKVVVAGDGDDGWYDDGAGCGIYTTFLEVVVSLYFV